MRWRPADPTSPARGRRSRISRSGVCCGPWKGWRERTSSRDGLAWRRGMVPASGKVKGLRLPSPVASRTLEEARGGYGTGVYSFLATVFQKGVHPRREPVSILRATFRIRCFPVRESAISHAKRHCSCPCTRADPAAFRSRPSTTNVRGVHAGTADPGGRARDRGGSRRLRYPGVPFLATVFQEGVHPLRAP